jgi:hypothetical protein
MPALDESRLGGRTCTALAAPSIKEPDMPAMLYLLSVRHVSPTAINQAVLYWDFLSTIVSNSAETRLNDPMRNLADRGFY